MHILAGKYKKKRLQSSLSPKVKPTVRRMRESLFEYIGDRIDGARFLDLCAGSGAVGIEALSRGAAHATFVDRSVKFCHFILANLDSCDVPEAAADVVADDAVLFLQRTALESPGRWDIVFYDPPYDIDYGPLLEEIGRGETLKPGSGLLIVEHSAELEMPTMVGHIAVADIIEQGDSRLTIFV